MVDNYSLWEAHDRERQKELDMCPICDYCGEPITDESEHGREEGYVGVGINNGKFVSEEDAYAYAFERCTNGTDEEIKASLRRCFPSPISLQQQTKRSRL